MQLHASQVPAVTPQYTQPLHPHWAPQHGLPEQDCMLEALMANSPSGHAFGVNAVLYRPAVQAVQPFVPVRSALNVPAPHPVHMDELEAAVSTVYAPAAHAVQAEAPGVNGGDAAAQYHARFVLRKA